MGSTLFDKIYKRHVVANVPGGMDVVYIDRHYIHEVTSPQAFNGLRKRNIPLRRNDKTFATADHNVPTLDQHLPIKEELSRFQVETLGKNCKEYNVPLYGLGHKNQGIVHVMGPELGLTLPGMTIVCGDSHTSTHGAFGCMAFGIGTSQVEQVMATQCLILQKPKTMRINIHGTLGDNIFAKDIILYIISKLTASGGTGYFIEYAGEAIRNLSMEARMTICNMSIEMGARGGLIAPDKKTFEYIRDRQFGPDENRLEKIESYWTSLYTDRDAIFDKEYHFDAGDIGPMVTFGTNPGMGIEVNKAIPDADKGNSKSYKKALDYMGFEEGQSLLGKKIDYVFIGSCTNSRIEDLRIVANYVKDKKKSNDVTAWIIPGSKHVEAQAKQEGLDKVFESAGFQLREPGCSACLGMNEDKVPRGKYCISTSNRNYEGRQGPGARTILASPLMAAAAAINGKIVDIREN